MFKLRFFKRFSIPELKSISGKRYSNLIVLTIIMLLSILTIGLGEGAKSYLSTKMNSPFVSFVNLTIPAVFEDDFIINEDKDDLSAKWESKKGEEWKESHNITDNTSSLYDYFGVKKPFPIYYDIRKFKNAINSNGVSAYIKRAQEDDPILNHIIAKDIKDKFKYSNTENLFEFDGWGCVVTEHLLKNKLGYENIEEVSYINYTRNIDGKYISIPIEIQGVVSSLPDNRDIIVGHKLFKSFDDINFYRDLILSDTNNGYLLYYVTDEDAISYLNSLDEDPDIRIKKLEENTTLYNKQGEHYRINTHLFEKKQDIVKNIEKYGGVLRLYDFWTESMDIDEDLEKEKIVFEFIDKNKLGKIELLNDFLRDNFVEGKKFLGFEMSVIEAKKNFDLFNRLSKLLSYALIFFSIYSIVIYITNIVLSHISKNKKNLGTLKAFGLSNTYIIIIYSTISIVLISIAFTLSYLISILLGQEVMGLMANYMEITDVNEFIYISYPLYILVLSFIILPSVAIFIKLKTSLHSSTPGDLIYDR